MGGETGPAGNESDGGKTASQKEKEGKPVNSFLEWLDYAEPIAYKIGIHPAEFDELQPGEFYRMLEAYMARRKDEDFRRSYFTAMMMNPHLKEPVNPQDIFNPLYYTPEEIKTMKEKEAQSDLEYFKSFQSVKERG
ncbi:hypothetical protein [Selenomonas ruminantium]|jgi:hypothetical protein|uniref:hypothetical protein n=1 Tax=Selenomonas ruminantium TaxID=971 RepID=UPI001569A736|nr:hypothetical protein [Selenomonas ruminantium]